MKREDSAFAVAHVARLQRLSAKLKGTTQAESVTSAPEMDEALGWSPFLFFGLVNQDTITAEETLDGLLRH